MKSDLSKLSEWLKQEGINENAKTIRDRVYNYCLAHDKYYSF